MWRLRVVRPAFPAAVLGLLLSTVLLAQSAPVTAPNAPSASATAQASAAIPLRPIAELRELALRATPPAESGEFRKPLLIELGTVKDDPIHLDIHYATANNFLGTPVYTEPRAFLQVPAAMALQRVAAKLKKQGYGLIVFDGYRPWFVTKIFWDATPPALHEYVANPSEGSRHNRGCAVDLSLYDLKTGQPVSMPSGYDEMTERAHSNYAGGTEEEREHRKILRETMLSEGFEPIPNEWWHYDYKEWREYPVLNLDFDKLPLVYRTVKGGTPARILKRVEPSYTDEAERNKYEGTVLLDLVVDANGDPTNITVVRSLGMGLDASAVEAAKQWKFAPATRNGIPVAMDVNMQVNFHLSLMSTDITTIADDKNKNIVQPVLIQKVEPVIFPAFNGKTLLRPVRVHLTITKDGSVKHVKVTNALDQLVTQSVEEAVRKWRYKPATKDGIPVETQIDFLMVTKLD